VPRREAELVFSWVEKFSTYGFPKSHAAAFAETAYATAYMLRHHPAEWIAAVLANQPMGFFSPRVLVNEARRRGVRVLPPDIRRSPLAFGPEDGGRAIRVGLSYCRGIGEAAEGILEEREKRPPFASAADLYRRTPVGRDGLVNLIRAGFLDHLGSRPGLLAEAARLPRKRKRCAARQPELPIPEGSHPSSWWEAREGVSELPGAALARDREAEERRVLRLDLRRHPLDAPEHAEALALMGVVPSTEVLRMPHGARARVAGLFECLQSPATRSGRPVWFLVLEDASGMLQVTFFGDLHSRDGHVIYETSVYLVEGRVERDPKRGFAFVADRIRPLGRALGGAAGSQAGAAPSAGSPADRAAG
jgi:error-prone DNA polymerase